MFALVFFGAGGSSAATDPGLIEARRALVEVLLAAPGSSSAEWTKKYDATIGAAERRLQRPAPVPSSRASSTGISGSAGPGKGSPGGVVLRRNENGRYEAAPLAGSAAEVRSAGRPGAVPTQKTGAKATVPRKETDARVPEADGPQGADSAPIRYEGPRILDFNGVPEPLPSTSPVGSP